MSEITVEDAKRVMRQGFRREVIEQLAGERGATALAAICVNEDGVEYSEAWGSDPKRELALAAWLGGYVEHVLSKADERAVFGRGTCVLIGVEADGTCRVVTYSLRREDCAAVAAADWGGRWLREQLTQVPWTSHLGVGNNGVPKPLTFAERLEAFARLPEAYHDVWIGMAPRVSA